MRALISSDDGFNSAGLPGTLGHEAMRGTDGCSLRLFDASLVRGGEAERQA